MALGSSELVADLVALAIDVGIETHGVQPVGMWQVWVMFSDFELMENPYPCAYGYGFGHTWFFNDLLAAASLLNVVDDN